MSPFRRRQPVARATSVGDVERWELDVLDGLRDWPDLRARFAATCLAAGKLNGTDRDGLLARVTADLRTLEAIERELATGDRAGKALWP